MPQVNSSMPADSIDDALLLVVDRARDKRRGALTARKRGVCSDQRGVLSPRGRNSSEMLMLLPSEVGVVVASRVPLAAILHEKMEPMRDFWDWPKQFLPKCSQMSLLHRIA